MIWKILKDNSLTQNIYSISTNKSYVTTRDYFLTGDCFDLHENTDRDILYTHPIPKDLTPYYDSEQYLSHEDSRKGIIAIMYRKIRQWMLYRKINLVRKHVKSKGRLLDIGAGTGAFVSIALKSGWEATGIEPNLKAREQALKRGVSLLEEYPKTITKSYQVISMWHVLEHLPETTTELARIKTLLSKDGLLVIAVPNYKSWDAQYYGNYWAAYDVPRHLWHFSREGIIRLVIEEGFTLLATRAMPFDAYYVSLLSERYKGRSMTFLFAIINGLRSNLSAWRTKEYSSNIFIFRKNKD